MSIPRSNQKIEFEMVAIDEPVKGIIEKVEEEQDHEFKGYTTKKGKVVATVVSDAIRFHFNLDGYEHIHKSRFMKFSYDDRSNLFNKYLKPLVSGMKPYMPLDVQCLVGMEVVTYWGQNDAGTFQHIETIIPQGKKIVPKIEDLTPQESSGDPVHETESDDSEVPF